MGVMADHETVARGDIFFTSSSGDESALPRPFVVAGRSVLLTAREQPKVLILGYGLGAMAAVMIERVPGVRIDGVEKSRDLARRARRLCPEQVTLHHRDAELFLLRTRRRYDLILDDCFDLVENDAVRSLRIAAPRLASRLDKGGIVMQNLLVDNTHPLAPQIVDLEQHFASVVTRRFRQWDNVLAFASQRALDPRQVRAL